MDAESGKRVWVGLAVVLGLALMGLAVDWVSRPAETAVTAPDAQLDTGMPGVGSLDDLLSQQAPAETGTVAGFGLAWGVTAAMVVGLGLAFYWLWQVRPFPLPANAATPGFHWLMPLLALAGLGVSVYLAYVETNTAVEAFCGPVGNCNAVQSSPYAYFLGVPVAVWGMINYVALLGMWAAQLWGNGRSRVWARLGLLLLTLGGVVFSIYLTYLEIFVIEAVCIWCISSAVITTLLLLLAVGLLVVHPDRPGDVRRISPGG